MTLDDSESPAEVVNLPGDYDPTAEQEEASPPGRLHGMFITGMAGSALVGIASMFALITVGLPANMSRFVIVVLVASAITFLACASAAVFSAARDTYPARGSNRLD